ncbi:MAG: helix-turn-helix domain-containing protein [Tannerellaceae bacterium]|nr:helix-turn-helix domain-containing protein [Tannerellaceae bacterium]
MREIISSNLPLAVIADKCGFATLSHMTDFCKKHIGMPPSQIRKGRKY